MSRNPLGWLMVFGPGAIMASITIGTGELIFSTRGGALFGYRILFLFVLISILKWGLVLAASRHMVLTGVHPYERMMSLPGPRGWFPLMLFLLAAVCMPIWVSFHSSVLGNLTSWTTGTKGQLGGGIDYLWGAAILTGVLVLTATGGYAALERIQLAIVTALVFCAGVTLILYNPDWLELFLGAIVPQSYAYPDWLPEKYPEIAKVPVWVETTRYVGVIGGAAYDYMAYTTFLRDKRWGRAGHAPVTEAELDEIAADPNHAARRWIRAPLIDCTLSFIVVVGFSAVFVASGHLALGPEEMVPDEANLLNLQARFVTDIHPWLLPLYVTGAFLTMLGTLYGTLEIANAIFAEMARTVDQDFAQRHARRLKIITVVWCAVIAYGVLAWMFHYQQLDGGNKPPLLLAILTPANLFTGVLYCGLLCLLFPWMDRRWLPKPLRMPLWLALLNLVSGVIFVGLGLKGYWEDQSRWLAIGGLIGVVVLSILVAAILSRPSDKNEG
jgi:hypothetical protein